MAVKSVELRQEAKAIHAGELTDLLKKEKRSTDETAKVKLLQTKVDELLDEARLLEKADEQSKTMVDKTTENRIDPEVRADAKLHRSDFREYKQMTAEQRKAQNAVESRIFNNYIAAGNAGLSPEENRAFMGTEHRDGMVAISSPITGYTANASFLVPQGFQAELETAMKAYGNMLGIARVIDTASGQPLYYPTSNDTTQQATVVGESVINTEKDLSLGHVLFGAWKLSSGIVKLSLELQQDSFESFEDIVKEAFAIRFGRGANDYFTNGTGSSQPMGFLTAIAASGATAVTAVGSKANDGDTGNTGANSIGYADLTALLHSVDPAYRDRPSAKFVMHDQVLAHLKTRLDKYGRPLWLPGIAVNAPDTIIGKPYSINQQMPLISSQAIFTGNTTIAFGDFSKFVIRRVKEMSLMRLVERYADFGQIGLLAFARYDSQLVDAGTHPLNVLVQA